MVWHGERHRHMCSSKGVKTNYIQVKPDYTFKKRIKLFFNSENPNKYECPSCGLFNVVKQKIDNNQNLYHCYTCKWAITTEEKRKE